MAVQWSSKKQQRDSELQNITILKLNKPNGIQAYSFSIIYICTFPTLTQQSVAVADVA